jgi:hypothetical protein
MEKKMYQLGDHLRIKVNEREFRVLLTFLSGERAGLFTYPTGLVTTGAVFGNFEIPIFRKGMEVEEEAIKNYIRASGVGIKEGEEPSAIIIEAED